MTNWQGQYHNPHERGWRRISNPTNFTSADMSDDGEAQIVDVEIIEEEQVFTELATQSEFEANVLEAYTDIGLPEGDPTFDELVNEMLAGLP